MSRELQTESIPDILVQFWEMWYTIDTGGRMAEEVVHDSMPGFLDDKDSICDQAVTHCARQFVSSPVANHFWEISGPLLRIGENWPLHSYLYDSVVTSLRGTHAV